MTTSRTKLHFQILLLVLFLQPVVAHAQPYGWLHALPNNNAYTYQTQIDAFQRLVARWGLSDFAFEILPSPSNTGSEPASGFSITDWFFIHTDARFLTLDTHGSISGPIVEAFEEEHHRNSRLTTLANSGWTVYDPSIGWNDSVELYQSYYLNPGNPSDTLFYGIGVTATGVANALWPMEAGQDGLPRGIAILAWCHSWERPQFRNAYFNSNGLAVFGSAGLCVPTDFDPITDVLACEYFFGEPSYDAYVCDAQALVSSSSPNIHMGINPTMSSCATGNYYGITGHSCNVPVVDFQSFGKFDNTVYWTSREESPTDYYVLGFNAKGEAASFVEMVPGNTNGGNDREVFYTHVVSSSCPLWEIVEVDREPQTPHTYSGYFEPGPQPEGFEAWAMHPVRKSSAELTSALQFDPVNPKLLVDGSWTSVVNAAPGGVMGASELSSTQCDSCPPSSWPPSADYCADWLVVSHDLFLATMGKLRQSEYLAGKNLSGWVPSSDPESVRYLLKLVICANRAYNEWLQANGQEPMFREKPFLTLIGSPGTYDDPTQTLTNVGVPYDVNSAGHIVDGMLAAPWAGSGCEDSVSVPYTRIPSNSAYQVAAAYDVAQEYSAGINVDPSRRVIQVAGDTKALVNCIPCFLILQQPVDFLNHWTTFLADPVNEMISNSMPCEVRDPMILDQVNQGAALFVSWSHGTTSHDWSDVLARHAPSAYSTHQNIAAIVPSCKTSDMIDNTVARFRPLLLQMLDNDPAKTRFAYLNGMTDGINYAFTEQWGMHLLSKIDEDQGTDITWQEVVHKAQLAIAAETGDWLPIQEIGNVGAPVKMPVSLTVSVGDAPLAKTALAVRAWPNPLPAGRRSAIEFSMPSKGRALVRVFSVTGRLVRDVADREFETGRQLVTWDGTDVSGRQVPAGIYFASVVSGRERVVAKIVKIK